ncbi:universal stress protein [Pseudomonas lactis]|mgnify:FL=1|jgi:nucleotide-binding universal stress UspA family protein|uniref:Universal stress protein n=3 Tax=Pseudomonas TaxID=286 RepID=I4KAG5_9PSED|nr:MULTISPECIES: universal stress protein [Pseudomonas]EIK61705.1 universal stress protein family protein [Pseudomonas lactis]KAA6192892.1 universal stress protein [Pseudomonas lactis]KRC94033.1 universal stress protein UspA [Pseudomonas sp. Root9]KRP78330.1 universal stress protein UspA [Pseudomonas lactis]KWV74117.1 Universal stress protein family protein [Pseudomonas fluorescens]
MIRSMLFATDLGLYAPYVMQHALALARTFKADLYVIHVVEPIGLFAESVLQSYLDEAALSEWQSKGLSTVMATIEQRVLDSFREEWGEGEQDLQWIRSVKVIQGDPCEVILDQLRKLSVDLLVVGSHSQATGVAVPLGRTAARVLQLSPVPVYLVPSLQRRRSDDS